MGTFARAIVVNEGATVDSILQWFKERWKGGGGLIVLPLDTVPESSIRQSKGLLSQISTSGEGPLWGEGTS
ncbi:MAG: hypothetical protein Ct9H300mP15_09800 [Gemmatimonadota bacterium]|nr:MAG: hypothetical protein Ct9H300mP15_09800 [Gemmatimonadota bacterium]